ncbi:N-acetyltransferase [Coniophora puteana RWD-64-598 SS2]|uniref:N-acetyltransferase n=1 Tax=Coniophora puteana (strain RWD-64-598) TaxID=741705 RepID=A0A5M3M6U8_CONPW|nr:N-acetyltransferase [Coniophora puteana RWD-64-598 SS2]EIW75072.1 N-acetyltransferase [Coniophora puteana RWD-64-598 SS2]
MSVIRPMQATDMLKFNNINLDIWTETFRINFYLAYLSRWPDLCCIQESSATAEGLSTEWHGHITALSVAPEYCRMGLSRALVLHLEYVSDEMYKGFFVDLYVRCTNSAIKMYEGFGYSVYRRVRKYYGTLGTDKGGRDEEDAFDMRKPLSRDPMRRSVRLNGRDVLVSAQEVS